MILKNIIIGRITKALLFFAMSLVFSGFEIFATPGDLDQSFGIGGKVKTVFPAQTTTFRPRSGIAALAIQPDGKIVAGGYAFFLFDGTAVAPAFAVTRYNTDGSLDSSFGNGGKVTTYFNGYEQINIIALQPDGKIVAGGFTDFGGNNFAFALARYNTNGSLDTTFDGDGKLVRDITNGNDLVNGLAIQPDGKIIASGYANGGISTDFAVMRFNSNGTNDSGFGTNGLARTDFAGGIDGGARLVLLPNGKIVVAGSVYDESGNGDFALVGYNADGSLDPNFGTGGKVRTDFDGQSDNAADMTIAPDGRIVVCGFSGPSGAYNSAVARYNQNGSLDTTFDGDGKFVVDLTGSGRIDGANGVAVQPNGKIVIVSRAQLGNNTPFDLAVARINQSGGLDSGFGSNGRVFTDFNDILPNNFNATDDEFSDVVIQPDGKIVAGGEIQDQTRIEYDMALARYIGDPAANVRRTNSDFDGDGKADISIFRPSDGQWWFQRSFDSQIRVYGFGANTDLITPADFTGDGKTDIAVFRPSTGQWFVLRSEDLSFYAFPFGMSEDVPVPGDYDGDDKADAAVFRPSNSTWYIQKSSGGTTIQHFGQAGDKAASGDYDGDGKADLAIFRPSSGQWWIQRSSTGAVSVFQFGEATDRVVPADYTGDGKADVAIFRPSNGFWYVLRSEDNSFFAFPFGASGDLPVAADYDGDGKTDAAVFRGNIWYLQRSTAGFTALQFGLANDTPVPSAYVR